MSTISTSKRSNRKSSATAAESATTSSGASIPSDAGYAAGISADYFASFDGDIADYSGSIISYDQSTPASTVQQSIIQESIETDVGHGADEMSADWRAVAEDSYDESGCDEPVKVGQKTLIAPDDNLYWDDEKSGRVGGVGRGVNDDSASLEVSAITSMRSAYTPTAASHNRPNAINKLNFSSLGLHGREKEVDLLRGCFDRFVAKKKSTEESDGPSSVSDNRGGAKSSEVVFISGESGTGKVSKRVIVVGYESIKTAV